MRKILLLSDTHGFIDDKVLNYCRQADEVWHAGDIGNMLVVDQIKKITKLRAVYGNIDDKIIRSEFPLDNIFSIENVKVWITHIGGYPNRYNQRIKEQLVKNPPDLFISGHSHILKVQFDKTINLLHLNPGAIGNYGIHQVKTMLRFEIEKTEIKNLEVIEIKKNT
ncbi:MAG: metallophosphatase family protein [Flavobacteriaceae bacterium]|nr:metallophosphatase family protein [Flavobacteriaceae bacterium]